MPFLEGSYRLIQRFWPDAPRYLTYFTWQASIFQIAIGSLHHRLASHIILEEIILSYSTHKISLSSEAEAHFSDINGFIFCQAFPFCFILPDCLQLISLVNHASKSVLNYKKIMSLQHCAYKCATCRSSVCLKNSNSFTIILAQS